MASSSNLSLPVPPRTPTPPSDDDRQSQEEGGLGLRGVRTSSSSRLSAVSFDRNSLAPIDDSAPFQRSGSSSSTMSTPAISLSPSVSGGSAVIDENDEGRSNPFRFQTVSYTAGKPLKSVPSQIMGQRRGHRYKHSSVSHQFFLEPKPRAPLRLPASLPVPTWTEGYRSMSTEQTTRMTWCFCHLFIAAYVQWCAQGSLALTALSHLIFYDAIGALLSATVDVLSNFEVWKRSSLRQPFGLERSEVLVGFAMSILLLFMGFDLISHNAGHILDSADHSHAGGGEHDPDSKAGHIPHREHKGHAERVPLGTIDTVALLSMLSTLVSAVMLRNHERMGKTMRLASIASLPSIFSNPSHLLTMSCSALLMLLPLMSLPTYSWMDRLLSGGMALAMCALGVRLVNSLGAMLLMSYSGPPKTLVPSQGSDGPGSISVSRVIQDIETDPSVGRVEEAKFWQVHYGLCMANLKLRARGTEDSLMRLRERVASLVRNRLGGGYGGGGGQSWEVSTQLILEKD